jgi:branched-chain amino acid transport system ATP-binding protein
MTPPILKVSQLHAGYGKAEVLHGLNLEAAKGSVVTVIGPNGAGKSTFLNSLMGILPAKGSIEFNGQSINALTLEERVMQGISLVPEKRELFSTMTV